MSESEQRTFWDRLFSVNFETDRETRVIEYIAYRLGDGAHLQEIVQEQYVRRNASPNEVEDILSNPKLVHAAREHMLKDFASDEFDPYQRPV